MDPSRRVAELIAPTVAELGFELVQVSLGGGQRPTLRVMIERADRTGMTVDDCATVSRALSAVLDVEDPISGAYTLEVSSPGIDRPLVRLGDFARFAGFEARIETHAPVAGRKRFRGRLRGVDGERVRLATEHGEAAIALDEIRRAKLVLTDELIAASQDRR